jgi:hypothetical protein
MGQDTRGSVAGLDHVRDRLERWRRTPGRGRGIPEEIWTAAVGLARQHGVSYIARSLGLSFDRLKSRLGAETTDIESVASSPGFVELGLNGSVATAGCEIELAAADGARMTVRMAGLVPSALATLADALWSRRG